MKFPTSISTLLLGAAAASSSSNAIALAAESSGYCPTIYADFVRRQLANFSPDGIFVAQEGESQKHTPFLTLSDDGKSATVIVGNGEEEGGVYHPMSASTDPLEVHFVTHILVKDQVSTNDILCCLLAMYMVIRIRVYPLLSHTKILCSPQLYHPLRMVTSLLMKHSIPL